MAQRVVKRRSVSYPISDKDFEKHKLGRESKLRLKKPEVEIKKGLREAEHVLVLNGVKQNSSIVGVKIKNKIGKFQRENLELAFKEVYDLKGVIYETGDYFFIMFSPLITKSFKNEVIAIKSAISVKKALEDYNKKFKEKIDFGIGVNSGEIINKIENGVLKFTGLGRTLNSVRRISELSKGEILIGKEIHHKNPREIKVEGYPEHDDVFKLKNITSIDLNKKFISDFLRKINETEKQ